MTSPAPQPAPLRPGQRAAKPAKAPNPRQLEVLALLAEPGAYAIWRFGEPQIFSGSEQHRAYFATMLAIRNRGWTKTIDEGFFNLRWVISPAGRAALRAGSGGGRGKRR